VLERIGVDRIDVIEAALATDACHPDHSTAVDAGELLSQIGIGPVLRSGDARASV